MPDADVMRTLIDQMAAEISAAIDKAILEGLIPLDVGDRLPADTPLDENDSDAETTEKAH